MILAEAEPGPSSVGAVGRKTQPNWAVSGGLELYKGGESSEAREVEEDCAKYLQQATGVGGD